MGLATSLRRYAQRDSGVVDAEQFGGSVCCCIDINQYLKPGNHLTKFETILNLVANYLLFIIRAEA